MPNRGGFFRLVLCASNSGLLVCRFRRHEAAFDLLEFLLVLLHRFHHGVERRGVGRVSPFIVKYVIIRA
jgi:hypothetical protein